MRRVSLDVPTLESRRRIGLVRNQVNENLYRVTIDNATISASTPNASVITRGTRVPVVWHPERNFWEIERVPAAPGQTVYVDSFTQPTVTGQVSYTGVLSGGVPFTPKAVMFFMEGSTADGVSASAQMGGGIALSSTSRVVVANHDLTDTGGSNNSDVYQDTTKCVAFINSSGAVLAAADLVSMDSGGFTLNWTTVDSIERVVNYIALGGAELTNVFLKELTSPLSTGNQSYTGVGFQPDCIIALTGGSASAPPAAATPGALSIGWALNATDEYQMSIRARLGDDGGDWRWGNDRLIDLPDLSFTAIFSARTVSLDADGFTLDWYDVDASALYCWVLCLKGGTYGAGAFQIPDATGNQAFPGVGFRPSGLLMAGNRRSNDPTGGGSDGVVGFGIGATSGASHRAAIGWAHADPTHVDRSLSRTAALELMFPGAVPSVETSANLVSFDADGFTLNFTSIGDVGRVHWLAFGAGA